MSAIDAAFEEARAGSRDAFGRWMQSVEFPIRRSLRRLARGVDVEAILQETLLRMWLLSQDPSRTLTGEDGSLRFAIALARNVGRSEARRLGSETLLPPEDLPEQSVEPDPPSDRGLRAAILECVERLAARPLEALRARTQFGGLLADRDIASRIGMSINTFLQNIVRARKQVAACLTQKGISLQDVLP